MSEENNQVAEAGAAYTLRRPFTFEEREVKELILDFERLTGEDILQAERRYYAEAVVAVPAKELSKAFQAYIVASAANVPVELVRAMPAKDFTSVTLDAQNFLLR